MYFAILAQRNQMNFFTRPRTFGPGNLKGITPISACFVGPFTLVSGGQTRKIVIVPDGNVPLSEHSLQYALRLNLDCVLPASSRLHFPTQEIWTDSVFRLPCKVRLISLDCVTSYIPSNELPLHASQPSDEKTRPPSGRNQLRL